MLEKVEGIVIRTRDYGETNKIVTIFTREKGKITVMARGAKKPKSRMAATTQPFVYAQFLVYIGSSMGNVQQAEFLDSMRAIREDISKTAYAAYLTELTDKLIEPNTPAPFLFEQLLQTFLWIVEDKDPDVLMLMYEMKMYKQGGFAPQTRACVNCGRQEEIIAFSVMEGGVLCNRCRYLDHQAFHLTPNLHKLLTICLEVDVKRVGNISVKEENKKKLMGMSEQYYERYGGYFLKSKKFLKQLDMLR
ncbi:DNA repair protein RecO [Pontibacillus halophilus JSM 076056 = DSM 19796]|uniref:DNA repair protein RecO n=1 Tax=Pontibacillus halophilus JSM 076056 = DSM 19796 TaxID=1385510 RepID=A0A0A5GJZ9_9BACI|nr:DNA repair protein RecO [Pontibacillus halophilus]KGX93591.1 DNA repair protein RecO [Pontibacillus halophilus JSM 076056 = DSM 19796]